MLLQCYRVLLVLSYGMVIIWIHLMGLHLLIVGDNKNIRMVLLVLVTVALMQLVLICT